MAAPQVVKFCLPSTHGAEQEVRVLPIDPQGWNLSALLAMACELSGGDQKITYQDNSGDWVTIGSDAELALARPQLGEVPRLTLQPSIVCHRCAECAAAGHPRMGPQGGEEGEAEVASASRAQGGGRGRPKNPKGANASVKGELEGILSRDVEGAAKGFLELVTSKGYERPVNALLRDTKMLPVLGQGDGGRALLHLAETASGGHGPDVHWLAGLLRDHTRGNATTSTPKYIKGRHIRGREHPKPPAPAKHPPARVLGLAIAIIDLPDRWKSSSQLMKLCGQVVSAAGGDTQRAIVALQLAKAGDGVSSQYIAYNPDFDRVREGTDFRAFMAELRGEEEERDLVEAREEAERVEAVRAREAEDRRRAEEFMEVWRRDQWDH